MSEGGPFNVGVIGAGIGRSHIGGYLANPDGFRVRTVCDLDEARAREAAKDIAGCGVVTKIGEVLADPDIDLVSVCLPPNLHFPVMMDVLAAGKHVVCEKPLTTSLKEVDEAAALSEKVGRRIFPVFQYRFGRGYQQFVHLVRQGLTGKAYAATIETHWRRTAAYYDNPWRGTWAGECGGTTVVHAIHIHNLLTHALGPVASVSAFLDTRVNSIETEDCAAIALKMANGALVTSSITLGSDKDMSRMRLCFENVTVESGREPYAVGSGDWTFKAGDPQKQKQIDEALASVPEIPFRFEGLMHEVHKALIEQPDAAAPTLGDARHSIELITAIYHAARTGTVVSLPIGTTHPLYSGWIPQATEAA